MHAHTHSPTYTGIQIYMIWQESWNKIKDNSTNQRTKSNANQRTKANANLGISMSVKIRKFYYCLANNNSEYLLITYMSGTVLSSLHVNTRKSSDGKALLLPPFYRCGD